MTKQKKDIAEAAAQDRATTGQLMTLSAAARALGVSSATVKRACLRHNLDMVAQGFGDRKTWHITSETLDRLKQIQTEQPTA